MGWFWADSPVPSQSNTSAAVRPPHGPNMSGAPPAGCPMHKKSELVVAEAAPPPTQGCPVMHDGPRSGGKGSTLDASASALATSTTSTSTSTSTEAQTASWSSRLNPLNMMPTLSQNRTSDQKTILSTSREISTIPKGSEDGDGCWEYPSPQQMYNALRRKGYEDTPEDSMETMVAVHNFLNEGAWREIESWERQFGGGVMRGLRIASAGGRFDEVELEQPMVTGPPRLLRFMGRPSEPTPKARMLNMLGRVYPSKFGGPLPFDRHDWFVMRQPAYDPNTTSEKPDPVEVRYVIDYYEGPPEPTGEPVFFLDVRPALDRPTALMERAAKWGGDVWWRASGAVVREEKRRKEKEERQFGGF